MLTGTNNEQKIWNFFKSKGILSDVQIAGLMGNLYAESGLNPANLQNTAEARLGLSDAAYTAAVDNGSHKNFASDNVGYGLCQWTYSPRKAGLLSYAKVRGRSIGDLEMQVEYIHKELTGTFSYVLTALKAAKTVREASDVVLLKFEAPADQSEAVKVKRASYGQGYYDKFKTVAPTTTPTQSTAAVSFNGQIKTAAELAARCKAVAQNYTTLYVHGCFGSPMTAGNKSYFLTNTSYNRQADRQKLINAASADTFGFDCVCLIKGLLWGWKGDKYNAYGGAVYKANGVPDIGSNQIITVCKNISTDFSKIEVGELLWMTGHVGIYIGEGLAVECSPAWKNRVQITSVNCSKPGYNRRNWTKHGKLPYVSYTGNAAKTQQKSVTEIAKEVIAGKWGSGTDRKNRLTAAGYDYAVVQAEVNILLKK